MAALGDGESRIHGALRCRDSNLMIDALGALGAEIIRDDGLLVHPGKLRGGATIDCGLAGTVMRFVPPLALLSDSPVRFVGDPRAAERPMLGLLDALRQLGAHVDSDRLPVTIYPPDGPVPREVSIDASASSQFVSGLLLVGCFLPEGLAIRHVGSSLPSRPHIAMTLAMLRERGVDAIEHSPGVWRVAPGRIRALDTRVEPDLTNAAAFLAAAAVTGGQVSVPGWPASTRQPGAVILDLLSAMGCSLSMSEGTATVRGPERLTALGEVDLHPASELTPVVAALAAVAEGETVISGVAHIRGHETDRLRALATELTRAGIAVEERPDGLRIVGGTPTTCRFETYADHRMVHFAALLGLNAPGSSVTDFACVAKTMPDFGSDWERLT